MAEHVYHERIEKAGLSDDCPGCARLAADPFHLLDANNFVALYKRTQGWLSIQGEHDNRPRSKTERIAMQKIYDHLLNQQRIEIAFKYADKDDRPTE